ncbi:dihydrofolate reductase family protein [Lacticigenium naphthae]|uniref:dihydrofolate reductase family protein n=1 Tax=Lacticigenium naphthae TaxID=515351 RepID=UPI00040481D0|nr:dihydrofolate reductase family protein [Lacticigenium naphthae]
MTTNRKLLLFIASSVDGFIATEDESLEWLFEVEGEGDNGYAEFYATVDTLVMGRKTYDWIMNQDLEEFPYKNKDCFVFTHSFTEHTADVTFIRDDPTSFIDALKKQAGKNIWLVGGGQLFSSFLQENLVDELIITVAPVLLGKGIPLFRGGYAQTGLFLKGMRNFNQFVELHYTVLQPGQLGTEHRCF